MKIFMHCEGCAKKIKKCLKGFDGVEDVETDCKTHKVTVKGKNANPIKVLERVQKKSGRKVELLSPIPKPHSPEDAKKAEEKKDEVKPEEKKEDSKAITVVLKDYMHCEGVEDMETDCKTHKVIVKGKNVDPIKVLEGVQKKGGRKVELLSLIPKPPSPEHAKKAKERKMR